MSIINLIDQSVFFSFKNLWKLTEKNEPYTYKLKNTRRPILDENNDLIIFRYPSHYRNLSMSNNNILMVGYISLFNFAQIYFSFKLWKKIRNYKILGFACFYSVLSALEAYFLYTRIKDVREVILHNGKILRVKTWQDEIIREMDVSEIRVLKKGDIYAFIDIKNYLNKSPLEFLTMEPDFGNMTNQQDIFEHIFNDGRYITYDI